MIYPAHLPPFPSTSGNVVFLFGKLNNNDVITGTRKTDTVKTDVNISAFSPSMTFAKGDPG